MRETRRRRGASNGSTRALEAAARWSSRAAVRVPFRRRRLLSSGHSCRGRGRWRWRLPAARQAVAALQQRRLPGAGQAAAAVAGGEGATVMVDGSLLSIGSREVRQAAERQHAQLRPPARRRTYSTASATRPEQIRLRRRETGRQKARHRQRPLRSDLVAPSTTTPWIRGTKSTNHRKLVGSVPKDLSEVGKELRTYYTTIQLNCTLYYNRLMFGEDKLRCKDHTGKFCHS